MCLFAVMRDPFHTNTPVRGKKKKKTPQQPAARRKLARATNEGKLARDGVNQSGNQTLAEPL